MDHANNGARSVPRPLMSTFVQSKDSKVMSVFRWKGMLDVVDKEWMCDSLADDDISVPEELDATLDDDASTLRFGMLPVNGREPPERWNDLGLDLFGPPQVPP